jgi:hypothetical protein
VIIEAIRTHASQQPPEVADDLNGLADLLEGLAELTQPGGN